MKDDVLASPVHALGALSKFVTMNEAEAARLARVDFGVDGRAAKCAGEKDDTFRISAPTGASFVLKATAPSEDDLAIDLQLEVLDHLAAADEGLPVPRVILNRTGERRYSYRDDAGQRRQIWMMSFLQGQPLSSIEGTPAGRREVGKTLARLRLALAGFSHAAETRIIPWDVQHLQRLEGLLGEIPEPAQRKVLEAGLTRFSRIHGRLAKTRFQVLHNDFNKANVLVDPSSPAFVSGIIDFGDAVRTSVAVDVATALMNQLPREPGAPDIFAEPRDVLKGYLTVADLTEPELSLVPHLMMGRVIARALLSISYANAVPENAAYFLRNTEQGWHQLDWFLGRSEDEVSDQLLRLNEADVA